MGKVLEIDKVYYRQPSSGPFIKLLREEAGVTHLGTVSVTISSRGIFECMVDWSVFERYGKLYSIVTCTNLDTASGLSTTTLQRRLKSRVKQTLIENGFVKVPPIRNDLRSISYV